MKLSQQIYSVGGDISSQSWWDEPSQPLMKGERNLSDPMCTANKVMDRVKQLIEYLNRIAVRFLKTQGSVPPLHQSKLKFQSKTHSFLLLYLRVCILCENSVYSV